MTVAMLDSQAKGVLYPGQEGDDDLEDLKRRNF